MVVYKRRFSIKIRTNVQLQCMYQKNAFIHVYGLRRYGSLIKIFNADLDTKVTERDVGVHPVILGYFFNFL